jgi:methionyl-tRNA formyltransferase
MKVIFMGTPEFAVQSLDAIVQSAHEVAAVVTAADKPAGRGKKLRASAVKEYALQHNIPVLQPVKLKDPEFLEQLKSYQADVFVVVAFRMLPEAVWAMPPKGTFNLHASLLPQYRGAAPINHAIINGETQSGVTTFFLDKEIDTGSIIFQESCPIEETDDAGILHDKLMKTGAKLVVKTLDAIANNTIDTRSQNELIKDPQELKPAPKIFKEDCRIDFSKDSRSCYNLIRGLSPYPGAFTTLLSPDGKSYLLKIFKTRIENGQNVPAGSIDTDGKKYLKISCADGVLDIKELQLQGKKRMQTEELLRGFKLDSGWSISENK